MPNKVLIWKAKHDDRIYPDHPESYMKIFQEMEESGDYEVCPPTKEQLVWYKDAKRGFATAAKTFLLMRSAEGYEYEGLEIRDMEK